MPRRRVPRPSAPEAIRSLSTQTVETRRGERWNVRTLRGSEKVYRCPGCSTVIAEGTPHVLVWPVQKALLTADAIDERRHWHTPCWRRES